MDSIRINISKDLEELERRMQRMVDEFFDWTGPVLASRDKNWRPSVDIYETEGEIVIIAELAGIKKKDIQVTLNKDLLTISGKRHEWPSSKRTRFYQMEIEYGAFQRTFRLPISVEEDTINATYSDGFLKITLPKKKAIEVTDIKINTD